MPLQGSYTWTEKRDSLKVILPLKGVNPSKVDIFVTQSTLKVNYQPYLVDVVLHGQIDPVKHKASVKDGNLHITLFKAQSSQGLWGRFDLDAADKDIIAAIKHESVAAHEKLTEELYEKKKDRATTDERYATRKQMALDEAERSRLEGLKEEEKKSAEKELYDTFAKMKSEEDDRKQKKEKKKVGWKEVTATSEEVPIVASGANSTPPTTTTTTSTVAPAGASAIPAKKSSNPGDIFDDSDVIEVVKDVNFVKGSRIEEIDDEIDADDIDDECQDILPVGQSSHSSSEIVDEEEELVEIKYIPPPRTEGISKSADGKVDIIFTPRVFPTPMRESKIAEEEDWIAKNRRHLKKHGVLGTKMRKGNGVDASEEDPQWLKAKGDDFYRGGDFRSALNAYSAALDADENMISCISNRAACYLQLGMLSECKVDCIAALELLEAEPSDGNVVMTIKVLMRRGATNCQLGLFSEALHDYKTAFQKFTECHEKSTTVPGITTESLSADVARLEQLVVVDELKKDADVIFGDGRLAEAADKYTEALALIPVHVGCLSNRSACKLAMQDVEGCVDDCTAALDLLQADVAARAAIRPGQSASDNMNMLTSILPPAGSEKRKSWVLKTILRRGTAYAQLGRLDEAVDDYRTASGLDPKNETLKSDMNKLVNLREGKRLAQ